jgi:hypothetical protein
MARIAPDLIADVESLLDDSSYSNIFNALEKLSDQNPKEIGRYIQLVDNEYGPGHRIRIKRFELLAAQGDRIAIDSLVEYLGPSYEFTTRQNAMNSVKRLNMVNDAIARNLIDALVSTNGRLAGVAAGTIDYMIQQDANRRAFLANSNFRDWTPAERMLVTKHIK